MKRRKIRYDPYNDYYNLIGVDSYASKAEIQKAYRQHAKKFHPDLNPDRVEWATERFQRLNEAYDVLSDPNQREEYDRLRWPHAPQINTNARARSQSRSEPNQRDRSSANDPWRDAVFESQTRPRRRYRASPVYTPPPRPGAWLVPLKLGFIRPFYAGVIELIQGPYRYLLIFLALVLIGNIFFILTNLAGQ